MFKHVEMPIGAHFTIVCTILLIRLGSKIQENVAKQRVYAVSYTHLTLPTIYSV